MEREQIKILKESKNCSFSPVLPNRTGAISARSSVQKLQSKSSLKKDKGGDNNDLQYVYQSTQTLKTTRASLPGTSPKKRVEDRLLKKQPPRKKPSPTKVEEYPSYRPQINKRSQALASATSKRSSPGKYDSDGKQLTVESASYNYKHGSSDAMSLGKKSAQPLGARIMQNMMQGPSVDVSHNRYNQPILNVQS